MNVLAFDCSTGACSAAVLADGRLLAHRAVAMQRGHAEALMPMVTAVLAESGLGWGEIGLIGVTVGPGSFTGLRIGLAAARGMALAGPLPVAGVGTALTMAHAVPAAELVGRRLLVAIDGKRADLFVQPFAADLSPLAAPAAMMPEAAASWLDGPLLLAGDGAARLHAYCPNALLSSAIGPVDAAVVARLAVLHHRAGTALPPLPLYLRPPDVTLPGPP